MAMLRPLAAALGGLVLLAPSVAAADVCPIDPAELIPALCAEAEPEATPCAVESVRASGVSSQRVFTAELGRVIETTDASGAVTARTTCIAGADGELSRIEHDTDGDGGIEHVVEITRSAGDPSQIEGARLLGDAAQPLLGCSWTWGEPHPVDEDDLFADAGTISLLGVESADASGVVIHTASLDYDLAGNLIARRVDRNGDGTYDGGTYRWEWDGDRLLSEGTDRRTLTYSYDPSGRVIERTMEIDGAEPRREVMRYLEGQVETTTFTGMDVVHVQVETLDAAGRVESLQVLAGDRVLSSTETRWECTDQPSEAAIQALLGS